MIWSLFRIRNFCFCIFPVFISGYISTPETVIDSILVDAPPYIVGQGDENAKVVGLENVFRCAPVSIEEIMLPPNINYNISACIAMDKLEVQVKVSFLRPKLSVGHLKLVQMEQ
nr:hypothetical transcript [Hymenolepis microstoma]